MWIYRPEDDNYFSQLAKCSDGDDVGECVIYFDPDDVPPSPAQGAMFADALNVHEATGLTPAQLQARVAELEAALHRVQKLTGWEAPDADSGAALNFNQGYESALEDVAAALGEA